MNSQLLDVLARLQSTPAGEAPGLKNKAAIIIQERLAAFQGLVQQNASDALGLAFAADTLAQLTTAFPESASQLESPGEWEGELEYLVEDHRDQTSRNILRLSTGKQILEVLFAGQEPDGLKSGDHVHVVGVRFGTQVAASSGNITTSSFSNGASASFLTTANAMCTTTGPQKSVVLLVTFPGVPAPAFTPSAVHDIFFATSGRSVSEYWREVSDGATTATGDVFGWFTLDANYTCDQSSSIRDAAIRAADSTVDFRQYNRIFIVFPDPPNCSWGGLGTMGCSSLTSLGDGAFTASTSWLLSSYFSNPDDAINLATHEGGHNLGLHHAAARSFATEPLSAPGSAGTLYEYGDPYSAMAFSYGHYAASHKAMLGWWSEGAGIKTVTTNGSYSLQPAETLGAVRALKIRRGTDDTSWLWLEYRRSVGLYDSTLYPPVFSGALIHFQDSTTGSKSHLIDFTPSGNDFWDPDLAAGKTWVDPYSNLSITVGSATSSALTVTVSYGPTACTVWNPAVAISPPNPSTYAGSNVTYTVSVTNNDSSSCASRTFSLTSSLPSGWTTTFSQATVTIAPGGTAAVTMTKSAPTTAASGTYSVNTIAASGSNTFTGAANVTVAAPCTMSNPSITLSPSNPSGYPGNSVTFNVSVTNNDSLNCAARTFSLTSSLPSGWITVFSSINVSAAPGATVVSTMTKTIPSSASPATYGVDANVAAGSTSAAASADVSVMSQPVSPTLTIVVSLTGSAYSPGSTVPISSQVKWGSKPAPGASIVFSITDPLGRVTTKKVTSDANGLGVWSYRIGPKDPKGSYSVSATGTYNSQTASASAPIRFSVN